MKRVREPSPTDEQVKETKVAQIIAMIASLKSIEEDESKKDLS